MRTFNEVPPEKHKEVSIKVIKFLLKNYWKLSEEMYPATGAVKTEVVTNLHPGDTFCLKLDIEQAIKQLPLNLKKIIIMLYLEGWTISKVCAALGLKFRVDAYRSLDKAFENMYEFLGKSWLKS